MGGERRLERLSVDEVALGHLHPPRSPRQRLGLVRHVGLVPTKHHGDFLSVTTVFRPEQHQGA
jgi:hypothetical protein